MNEYEFFEDYYKKGKDAWEIFSNQVRTEKFFKRVKIVKEFLKNTKLKNPLILDIGCGNGEFAKFINEKNLIGLDISYKAVKNAKKSINFSVVGNAIKLPFKNESFDVVLCIETLYYQNKNKMIKEIYRVLKKKGFLILSLGNQNSIRKKIYQLIKKDVEENIIYSKNKKKWEEKRYYPFELKNLFKQHKFKILTYKGILFDLPLLSRYKIIRNFFLFPLGNIFKNYSNQIVFFMRK